MACGCSGSGTWQAEGMVPAASIFDASYFAAQPGAEAPSDEPPEASGFASWTADGGTTRPAED